MSKVFFSDTNAKLGDNLLLKFKRLLVTSGIDHIDFQDKLVAIKLHMGEWGNVTFLRQQYARVLCEYIKNHGGNPFITDCNTLYPGRRGNAVEHLECAAWNGYNMLSCGVPVIIGDGLRGTDEREICVENAEYCKKPKIGSAIAEADVIISLSHAKGHESAGFGGCLKNLGMGCGSKKGKMEMHSHGTPFIRSKKCIGCGNCVKHCANNGVEVISHKAVIIEDQCLGCGYCMAYCSKGAINCKWDEANSVLNCKISEYAAAVIQNKPSFHINIAMDIQHSCDCNGEHHQPIVPDVGFFASFDPVAIDQATIDAINKMPFIPESLVEKDKDIHQDNNIDSIDKDIFEIVNPNTRWQIGLDHAEKLGIGSRAYELIII